MSGKADFAPYRSHAQAEACGYIFYLHDRNLVKFPSPLPQLTPTMGKGLKKKKPISFREMGRDG